MHCKDGGGFIGLVKCRGFGFSMLTAKSSALGLNPLRFTFFSTICHFNDLLTIVAQVVSLQTQSHSVFRLIVWNLIYWTP